MQTLTERGLIEESGRSRFGAVIYRTTPLFERLFGLAGLDALPDPARFDPTPEDEAELRERLLKAGEQRAASSRAGVRLAKYLAHCGVASRRAAEKLIAAGRVTRRRRGRSPIPARDVDESSGVAVDGRPVAPEPREVWVLNKPAGVDLDRARAGPAAGGRRAGRVERAALSGRPPRRRLDRA